MDSYLHICTVRVYNGAMNTKPLGTYIKALAIRRKIGVLRAQKAADVSSNYVSRLISGKGGDPILAKLEALVAVVGGDLNHIQQLTRSDATEHDAYILVDYVLKRDETGEARQAEAQSMSDEELRQAVAEFEREATNDKQLLALWRSVFSAWRSRQ